jgi:hypothetical protein
VVSSEADPPDCHANLLSLHEVYFKKKTQMNAKDENKRD